MPGHRAGGVRRSRGGSPQTIVSLGHVERKFTPQEQSWFADYAWPLSEGLHAMWSEHAEDWKPINHACDPNTWLDGLDLVARRDIRRGEAITMDYATFCGPRMRAFECRCGASQCRAVVRPEDHLAPWLGERYGDHISDYVRQARRELALETS